MPGFPDEPFPARPFFSCEESRLLILDKTSMGQVLRGQAEPWLQLNVGPSNVIDSRPLRVLSHSGLDVEVECESSVVKLNMEAESARKTAADGREYVYRGGLDEANSGLGWMPVS